jgi:hypothetical protein
LAASLLSDDLADSTDDDTPFLDLYGMATTLGDLDPTLCAQHCCDPLPCGPARNLEQACLGGDDDKRNRPEIRLSESQVVIRPCKPCLGRRS